MPAPAPEDWLLRCEKLVIGHGNRPLLPAMDLSIERGTFVAVIGRNGSGKSTWLRTVLGFVRPIAGRVAFRRGLRLGYMPQALTLDPLLPVRAADLVEWGCLEGGDFVRPFGSRANRSIAAQSLAAANATALGGILFRDLSEGQKQRVLLARVIARAADVAFLDEPTAAMDAVAERDAISSLKAFTRERGMTVVVVTHLLSLVSRFADQVVLFDREHGATLTGDPAAIFAHPAFREQYGELGAEHAR